MYPTPPWALLTLGVMTAICVYMGVTSGRHTARERVRTSAPGPSRVGRIAWWTGAAFFGLLAVGSLGGAMETAAFAAVMSAGMILSLLGALAMLLGTASALAAIIGCVALIRRTTRLPHQVLDTNRRRARYLGAAAGLVWSCSWALQIALQVAAGDIDALLSTLRWDAILVIGTNLLIAAATFAVGFADASQEEAATS